MYKHHIESIKNCSQENSNTPDTRNPSAFYLPEARTLSAPRPLANPGKSPRIEKLSSSSQEAGKAEL
jgi:hypothetical protein